jgi:hypothetical protein
LNLLCSEHLAATSAALATAGQVQLMLTVCVVQTMQASPRFFSAIRLMSALETLRTHLTSIVKGEDSIPRGHTFG